jgi:hypothetical protein
MIDFQTAIFHPVSWNRYLLLGFGSTHNPCSTILHPKIQLSYNTSFSRVVQQSATTLSNINRMEYTLTGDAQKKSVPTRNKIGVTLDMWTSTHKLAILLGIAYIMSRYWASREVNLTLDDVETLWIYNL